MPAAKRQQVGSSAAGDDEPQTPVKKPRGVGRPAAAAAAPQPFKAPTSVHNAKFWAALASKVQNIVGHDYFKGIRVASALGFGTAANSASQVHLARLTEAS